MVLCQCPSALLSFRMSQCLQVSSSSVDASSVWLPASQCLSASATLAIPIDCDSGCLRAHRSSSYCRCLPLSTSNPRLSTGVPVLVRVRVRPTASGRSESRQSTSGCHCPLLLQVQVHGGRPACHSCWNPQAHMNVPGPNRTAGPGTWSAFQGRDPACQISVRHERR